MPKKIKEEVKIERDDGAVVYQKPVGVENGLTVVRFKGPITMAGGLTVCGPKEAKKWVWSVEPVYGQTMVILRNEKMGKVVPVHFDRVESFGN